MSLGVSPSIHQLDHVLETYRRHGFDAGYDQALRDQLAGLVLNAERFLGGRDASAEERKLIYQFVARLESLLTQQSPFAGPDLIDGAGI